MLLEDLKPLQIKSRIILQDNGPTVGNQTIQVGVNVNRHSFIVHCNGTWAAKIGNFVINETPGGGATLAYHVFTYDDYGDLVKQIDSVFIGNASLSIMIVETYTEERPVTS